MRFILDEYFSKTTLQYYISLISFKKGTFGFIVTYSLTSNDYKILY